MVNGRLIEPERPSFGPCVRLDAIKPPFTKRRLCLLDPAAGGAIFLNSLLVFAAADIAVGVNHSGDSDRLAVPLGRREE
jgi:hypothetical protein